MCNMENGSRVASSMRYVSKGCSVQYGVYIWGSVQYKVCIEDVLFSVEYISGVACNMEYAVCSM